MSIRLSAARAAVVLACLGTVLVGTNPAASASSPTDLGGTITATPSCVAADHQGLRCFARGTDARLYYRDRTPQGSWSGWQAAGTATVAGRPECISKGPGDYHCFARTTAGTMIEIYWSGGWYSFDHGGSLGGDLSCVTRRANPADLAATFTDCFAYNTAGNLMRRAWTGSSWAPWQNLGGVAQGRPSCYTEDDHGDIDCAVINGSGNLYLRWTHDGGSSWQGFQSMGSGLKGDPSCLSRQPGTYDCFALGADSSLRQIAWNSSGVPSAYDISGGWIFTTSPECVTTHAYDVGCFVRGMDGKIYSRIWTPETGWQWYATSGTQIQGNPGCSGAIRNEYDCASEASTGAMVNWQVRGVGPTLADQTALTTHNSYANYEDSRWTSPNQSKSIANQLNAGVRGFMIDTYQFQSSTALCIVSFGSDCYGPDVYLCHESCTTFAGVTYALPRQRLSDELNTMISFLNAHPSQIVTVYLEDYTQPAELQAALGRVSGLSGILFNPQDWNVLTRGWPSIREMVAANKRLLIMSDHDGRQSFGVVHDSDYTVQNYWSIGDNGDQLACTSRWGGIPLNQYDAGFKRLFVMSHFRNVATAVSAAIDNGTKLQDRIANTCTPAAGRKPNYVSVDFFETPLSTPNPTSISAAVNAS